MKYILLTLLFFSCVTEKKATRWMNEHPTEAAGYCADEFPVDTTSKVVYDSVDFAAYEAAYWEMAKYADSLFNQLDSARQAFIPTPERPCPPLINLDSLRRVVDLQIRQRLIPCVDSIEKVINNVVDRAREKQLQGQLDQKDAVITAQDKYIAELKMKAESRGKWIWRFWALVVAIGVTIFLLIKRRVI